MNDKINDGGPAFPINLPGWGDNGADGMTLRDYFAGQALAGMLGDSSVFRALGQVAQERGYSVSEAAAVSSYQYANAMLEARRIGDGN